MTPRLPPQSTGGRPVGGSFTFGGRKGRMSATRQRALDELVPIYLARPPFDVTGPIVVEIGCGKGEATASMAVTEPNSFVIACEANDATIAYLASQLDALAIDNVRLWVGDAFEALLQLGARTVAEIRVWFPDPWPKPRHAHKRLITPERLAVITDALEIGGRIRLATDDASYAEQALSAIDAEPRLRGGVVPRPAERPITTFEARGLREGRDATDIEATRIG